MFYKFNSQLLEVNTNKVTPNTHSSIHFTHIEIECSSIKTLNEIFHTVSRIFNDSWSCLHLNWKQTCEIILVVGGNFWVESGKNCGLRAVKQQSTKTNNRWKILAKNSNKHNVQNTITFWEGNIASPNKKKTQSTNKHVLTIPKRVQTTVQCF